MKTKKNSNVLTVKNIFFAYFFCFLIMSAESAIENGHILAALGLSALISVVGTFLTLVVFAIGKKFFPKHTKKVIRAINSEE